MEQEIDVLKLIRQNRLERFLQIKKKLSVIDLASFFGAIDIYQGYKQISWFSKHMFIVLNTILFSFLMFIWKEEVSAAYQYDEYKIKQIVKESESYKRLNELYFEKYIKLLGEYFKTLGFSSCLEANFFLEKAFKYGYFSVIDHYSYHDYKHEYLGMPELLGSRVLSGYGVCRHSASFYKDVLNATGYECCLLSCDRANIGNVMGDDLENFLQSYIPNFSHAVTGVSDENYKYVYDSINGFVASITDELQNKSSVLKVLDLSDFPFMYILNENFIYSDKSLDNFQQVEFSNLEYSDIFIAKAAALLKFENEKAKLTEIKNNELERMQEIVRLENLVSPHSDELLRRRRKKH